MRLVHIHIPKTAGTALKQALSLNFPPDRCFNATYGPEFEGLETSKYDFFSGHIGFDLAKSLDAQMITVLRDPIDRFVSVYYYWRQLVEKEGIQSPGPQAAMMLTLEDFVERFDEPVLIAEFYNRVTWQLHSDFSLAHRRKNLAVTQLELLQTAKDNLNSVDVVGRQEAMADLIQKCQSILGIDINVQRLNPTFSRPSFSDVPRSIKRRITNWVELDLELYWSYSRADWDGKVRPKDVATEMNN